MDLDHAALNAEEWTAAVLLGIELLFEFLQIVFDHKSADFALERAHHRLIQISHDKANQTFGNL